MNFAPHIRGSGLGGYAASRYYNRRRAELRRCTAAFWRFLGA
ncbi:MAG: hypothetical protein ACREYA_22970 [Cupriavidus necator]